MRKILTLEHVECPSKFNLNLSLPEASPNLNQF